MRVPRKFISIAKMAAGLFRTFPRGMRKSTGGTFAPEGSMCTLRSVPLNSIMEVPVEETAVDEFKICVRALHMGCTSAMVSVTVEGSSMSCGGNARADARV